MALLWTRLGELGNVGKTYEKDKKSYVVSKICSSLSLILDSKISKYGHLKNTELSCCYQIIHVLGYNSQVASSFMQFCVAPWKSSTTTCNSKFVSFTHKRIKGVAVTKGNNSLSRYETPSSKVEKTWSFLNEEILADIVLNQGKNVVFFYTEVSNNSSVTKIEEQQAGQETLPFYPSAAFPIQSCIPSSVQLSKGMKKTYSCCWHNAASVKKGSSEVPNYRVSRSFEVTYIPFAA